ncbi:nucleolar protein dao-5-like isoform X8 [Hypanus sabinus]|uniref:nucleolar protein dao-5-like isoform X8 n=1 Tax=Hypanus sabinus TaxID=79690 RepID=UPI0028C3DA32|nr:nucleolar protein dao-5-like isoform X8 [Hypanus sabinus]
MLTRRRTLRSGGPVSAREEEAQEDDLPKMQQPQRGVLQSTPFTRSRYRKVEQVSEDISPRRSPCVTSAGKSPKALQLKEKAICGIPLPQEEDVNGNSTLTENNDLPKLWLTETPAAKLEKDVKKPVPRKSLRIAKMLNLSTSVNIDSSCMPGGGTKSEEHVDASCEPAVMKQTEMQSPKKKEKTEAVKVDQESLDEGKVVRRSSRVTVTSPSSVRERESSSAKSKCKKELHSESGSDGAMAADSKNSYSDKEVQTVIWKITLGAEEELTPHDPETKDGLLLQDTGDTTSTSSALRNGGDISSPRKARGTSSSPSPRKAGISSSSSPSPSISKVVVTSSSPNKAIDVFLSSTHSTRRTRVISSSSPSLRNAKDVSSSPSLRKAEDVSSSPSLRKAEDVSSSPSLRKDEDVSSPSLRKAKDVSSSPSLRKAKDVSSSPSLRKAKDVSSPSLRKAKDTSSSPSLRKAKDISPSPSLRSAKDISSSPSLRKAKDISPSPSLRSAKDVSSPSLRKAKDVSSTPSPRKTREAASCSPRKAGDTASPSFPPKAGKTSFPSPSPMKAGDTACPLFPQKAGEPPFSSPSPLMVGDTASSPSPLKAGDTASSPSPLKAGDATSSPSPLKAMGTTSDNSPLKAGGTVSSLLPLKAKGTASTPSPLKTGLTASSPSPLKARDTASSPSPRKTDSHRKSQESAAKEMPLIKTWNLRRQSLKLDVPSNVEEKVNTEPPTTGVVSSKEEVADKEEREKVEVKEADKIIKKADDQVTEVPEDLGQETQEKPMEKRKKATKSGDKARHELIMSNLDSSKSFSELQIAVIRFFVEKQLSITSVGIRKSRKLGQVTFLTRKDLIQALQSNGEELLGRPLQLIRPEWIEKSLATDHGKKRKLTELDQDSAVPSLAKKKRIQKSSVLIKSRKNSTFLIRKRKSSVVSTKKSRKNSLSPIEREKSITGVEKDGELNKPLQKKKKKKKMQEEGEKKQAEESCTLSSPQKKRKLEETILDDSEDKAAVLQKKKKKKLEKALVKEEREVEKEDACLPPKKKKHQEMAVLNKEKDRKKEAAPQKKKNKASWCLYLQNIGFQQKHSKIKASIGNFLKEKSISYKEIVLHPSRCSACIELHCEEDVDKALKFDECTIIGEAVKLNKVVKLGALEAESRRTLYIRSLPREVSAKNLKKLFEKVAGVWIQENQKSTKRFALIAFKTTEAADGALSKSEIECKGNLIQLQSVHQRSKEKKKILMVNNLPRPLSKTYLKSLFTDAKDIRISDESDCPAHGVAYIEYKTAKQAKAALKRFKKKGVQGQVIQVDSLEAKKEKPEKSLIQGAKEKKQGKKITEAKKEGSLERRLPAPCDSLFVQNLSSKAALDDLRSTFKGSIGAKIQSSKKQY